MAWNRRVWVCLLLAVASTFGSTGCLLYTGSINSAPMVTIEMPQMLVRGTSLVFTANVHDDEDAWPNLRYAWGLSNGPCPGGGALPASSDQFMTSQGQSTFDVTLDDAGDYCVSVEVLDRHGAPSHSTAHFKLEDRAPIAVISSIPGAVLTTAAVGPLPLYSPLHFSHHNSVDPDGKDNPSLSFTWSLTGPTGSVALQDACPGTDGSCFHRCDATSDDVCFRPLAKGTYTLTLDVADATGLSGHAMQTLMVLDDQAPCIAEMEPATQNIVRDPSQPLTFQVDTVQDDGDPLPSMPNWPSMLNFRWAFRLGTTGTFTGISNWDLSNLTFAAGKFQPGQTLQVRAIAHDRRTTEPELDACMMTQASIDQITCEARPGCNQWVTWTVDLR